MVKTDFRGFSRKSEKTNPLNSKNWFFVFAKTEIMLIVAQESQFFQDYIEY